MNTRQIEYFLAVADELNFTRAAEKLYVGRQYNHIRDSA